MPTNNSCTLKWKHSDSITVSNRVKVLVLWIMEKLSECKWELYKAYIQSKRQRREVKHRKHAKLGTILKVMGSIGGLDEERFHFPAVSQESTVSQKQGEKQASTASKSTLSTMLFIKTFSPIPFFNFLPDNSSFTIVCIHYTSWKDAPLL